MFPALSNNPLVESIGAISVFCLCYLIINFANLGNAFRNLISLFLVSVGLIHGLNALATQPDGLSQLFCTWAFCGAIAQFSFAGALFMGLAGGFYGVVLTLVLGCILCPIIWVRIVFNIFLLAAHRPMRSGILALVLLVGGGCCACAPSFTQNNTVNLNDYRRFYVNQETDLKWTIYRQLTYIRDNYMAHRKPVCYAVTVENMRSGNSQVLVVGVPYDAKALSPCDVPAQFFDSAPLFTLRSVADSTGCCISAGSSSAVLYLNGMEVGSEPQVLNPGMMLSIQPNPTNHSKLTLRIKSLEYLNEDGECKLDSINPLSSFFRGI